MYRVFVGLLFISAFGFAQQNSSVRITGGIPGAGDSNVYLLQVGAFRVYDNAQRAFERLKNASLESVFESYQDLIRVMVVGIRAADVPVYIERMAGAGFFDILVRIDPGYYPVPAMPGRTAPPPARTEAVPEDVLAKTDENEDIPELIPPEETPQQPSFFIWRSAGQPPRTIILNRSRQQEEEEEN